jgi:hypothetical protein
VLTGNGVTTWRRRTLADLIPAASTGGPALPAATRELTGVLAAMRGAKRWA